MSDRVDRYCLTCGNVTVVDAGYYAGSSFYQCETCGRRGDKDIFPKATVFHKITSSPEELASNLVYSWDYYYYSTIIPGKHWGNEKQAYEATVARLKEVRNG
jgi:hypothetical protein